MPTSAGLLLSAMLLLATPATSAMARGRPGALASYQRAARQSTPTCGFEDGDFCENGPIWPFCYGDYMTRCADVCDYACGARWPVASSTIASTSADPATEEAAIADPATDPADVAVTDPVTDPADRGIVGSGDRAGKKGSDKGSDKGGGTKRGRTDGGKKGGLSLMAEPARSIASASAIFAVVGLAATAMFAMRRNRMQDVGFGATAFEYTPLKAPDGTPNSRNAPGQVEQALNLYESDEYAIPL